MKIPSLSITVSVARPAWCRRMCAASGLVAALLGGLSIHSYAQTQPQVADTAALFAKPVARSGSVELDRVHKFDTLASDRSVSRLIERWARQAGVNYVWGAPSDVTLGTQDRFVGTIEQAIDRLLNGVSGLNLQACIYNNNPPVIRITESGTPCE